jgi:hypothetical protein
LYLIGERATEEDELGLSWNVMGELSLLDIMVPLQDSLIVLIVAISQTQILVVAFALFMLKQMQLPGPQEWVLV